MLETLCPKTYFSFNMLHVRNLDIEIFEFNAEQDAC